MKRERTANTKWGQLTVYGLLLVLVICSMLWLKYRYSGVPDATPDAGVKADTVNAAVVYGPTSYRVLISDDGNDSITGINYHMLRSIEDSLGVKVVLHPVIDRDDALAKVAAGTYDILASLPADNYLKQNFLTSDEVYLDRLVLIQKRRSDGTLSVESALDLAGDTVHVEKGSAATRRLENLGREIGGDISISEEAGLSEEYIAIKVATGEWKYAVVNGKTAEEMKRRYPDLDYSTPVSFTQFQVWVLPQGRDSLLTRVNAFIGSVKK